MDDVKAAEMLMHAAGIDHAGEPPAAALSIATKCGRLPLALSIAGRIIQNYGKHKVLGMSKMRYMLIQVLVGSQGLVRFSAMT